MLQGELARHDSEEGARWAETLKPLGDAFVKRFEDFLPIATYPVRVGVHSNTAFALILALDYARGRRRPRSDRAVRGRRRAAGMPRIATARRWEPSQDEFLSPALIEAACMRRVLQCRRILRLVRANSCPMRRRARRRPCSNRPRSATAATARSPIWTGSTCRVPGAGGSSSSGLADADPLRATAEATIAQHLDSALAHIAGDYMGEHWLASFALLALDPVSD